MIDLHEENVHYNPLVYKPRHFNPSWNMDGKGYNFTDCPSDVQSIIHSINFLGEDLVGAEIGVAKGHSFMTLLHNCPNIKTLHGVDHYQPYEDYFNDVYDESRPAYTIDEKQATYSKIVCYNFIKFSGMEEKVKFHEMESDKAAEEIEDGSLDFIFVDAYLTYEQTKKDLNVWYPKVREGGIFAGHDYRCNVVEQAVDSFRKNNNITNKMSVFDETFIWYK